LTQQTNEENQSQHQQKIITLQYFHALKYNSQALQMELI